MTPGYRAEQRTESDPAGLPAEFVDRLKKLLPADRLQPVLATFAGERPAVCRPNGLKTNLDALQSALAEEGIASDVLALPFPVLRVSGAQRETLTRSAAAESGLLYLQNPSSMVAVWALDPRPGEEILDLAAAPGGKTLMMAAAMENRGRIAAVEPVRHRYFRLRANLERHGATCVVCYLKDGRSVWRHTPERFDRVLLDAPCSSEARFRAEDPRSHRYWSRRKIGESSRKQRALIQSAFQCLRPGGRLVYSTCSFAPEENEAVVAYLAQRFPCSVAMEPVEMPGLPTQPAIENWADTSYGTDVRRALRILPDGVFEGFFVCRIRKLRSTRQDSVLNNPRRPARSTRRARRPGRR